MNKILIFGMRIRSSYDNFNPSFVQFSYSQSPFRSNTIIITKGIMNELYVWMNQKLHHQQHRKILILILHFWPLSLLLSLFDLND
jgi:hypothetical protein